MAPQRRVEQRAELRIYGPEAGPDFDPDELSGRLCIAPHTVWRRGETLRSGRVRPSTLWWRQTPDRDEVDSEAMVLAVLDMFEPVAKEMAQCRAEWDLQIAVGLVVHMSGVIESGDDGELWADVPTPALAFSLETLGRLARLKCSLDIDQYVSAPDHE